MTIPSTPSEISYAGDDVSVDFVIPFVFDTSEDLKVIETDEDGNPELVTTGFSVAGGAGAGGTLTRDDPLPIGTTLTILDDLALTQPVDYIDNDRFAAETHEGALDRVTRLVKRISQRFVTAIRVPDGDPESGDGMELGSVDNRKGKYLFFNAITGAIEYVAGVVTTTLSQSIIAALLNPQTLAEAAAGVTPTNYQYPPGDLRRYGADLDGVADDAAALTAAVAQQQQSEGATVEGVPGLTCRVATWAAVTCTAALRIRGNGMTIQCANATRVAFIVPQANIDIEGVTFDGFYRVVNGHTQTAALTSVRIHNCRFINATTNGSDNITNYIVIHNPLRDCHITENVFKDGHHAPIWIGDNTYANQDIWESIVVRNNRVDGVTALSAGEGIYGILVFGRDVVIDGNKVNDVDCHASANVNNEAYGIYTKCRYAKVVNNTVRRIGLAGSPGTNLSFSGINVKGLSRSATATTQGFNCIVANNTVESVGVVNVSGTGISSDRGDFTAEANLIELAGLRGILANSSATAGEKEYRIIANNTIRQAATADYGIDCIGGAGGRTVISGNTILGGDTVGILYRAAATEAAENAVIEGNVITMASAAANEACIYLSANGSNITRALIANNVCAVGVYGVYLDPSTAALTTITVCDNDLSGCTTKIGGTPSATTRIRNNRGYVSEAGGVTAGIATGATVTHGMSGTPTIVHATPLASGPTDVYITAIGGTTFAINFGGGGTVAFAWEAKLASHYQ